MTYFYVIIYPVGIQFKDKLKVKLKLCNITLNTIALSETFTSPKMLQLAYWKIFSVYYVSYEK
jgi:hypothetical protein